MVVPNTVIIIRALFFALLISLPMSWIGFHLARWLKVIDYPGSAPHKSHTRPVPLAGGFVILITIMVTTWLLHLFAEPTVRAALLAGMIIFLFGLWDDYKELNPGVKFLGQILAGIALIRLGVHVQIFESPEFFLRSGTIADRYLDWLVTVFWVVGITNAFNFIDSMDGLATGIAAISAAFFILATLDAGQVLLSQYSTVIMGICAGIYLFNASPAIIFLGDSGAQLLGFLMATLSIGYTPQGAFQSSSWMVPILLMGIPVFDASLVIISRVRRRKNPFRAARDHTYHRLRLLGLDSNRAVLVMQITAFALCCMALIILYQPPLIANLLFLMILALGGGGVYYLEKILQQLGEEAP